jgi:methionine biosynthesis protein MetW
MRPDLDVVAELVPAGSRVLDLGCGSGELLAHLFAGKGCTGTGVEIDEPSVLRALRAGVPVIDVDIDEELGEFADDSYGVVVLSRTLQALRRPAEVLTEIRRVGARCVVSVPNFGLWRHRVALLTRGRMPVSAALPYPWYETPNIHLSTLADLEELVGRLGFHVERRLLLDERGRPLRGSRWANLRAGAAVYLLSR